MDLKSIFLKYLLIWWNF